MCCRALYAGHDGGYAVFSSSGGGYARDMLLVVVEVMLYMLKVVESMRHVQIVDSIRHVLEAVEVMCCAGGCYTCVL